MSPHPIPVASITLLGTILLMANLLPIQALAANKGGLEEFHASSLVPRQSPEALQAALKGKQSFALLARNDNLAKDLGFQSAAEATDSQTSLGPPFSIVRVRVNLLRDFHIGTTDPLMMLEFGGEFIYPVAVNNQVRSSLTVTEIRSGFQSEPTWRTTEWGSRHLIQHLEAARKTTPGSSSSFALLIPELGQYFLGNLVGSKIFLIPLNSDRILGLEYGVPLAAEIVFDKLLSNLLLSTPSLGKKP